MAWYLKTVKSIALYQIDQTRELNSFAPSKREGREAQMEHGFCVILFGKHLLSITTNHRHISVEEGKRNVVAD